MGRGMWPVFAFLALSAALLAAVPAVAQDFDTDVKRCGDEAVSAEMRIASCTRILESGRLDDVSMGFAFTNRSTAYYALGRYKQALSDSSQAVRLAPGYSAPFLNRANVYAHLGMANDAIRDLDRAIDIDPKNALAWHNRGQIKLDANQLNVAINDLDKAIELDPANPNSRNVRALAYRRLAGTWPREDRGPATAADFAARRRDDYNAALRDHNEAIRLSPREATYYRARGGTYAAMKEFDHALADYSEAIRLAPRQAEAYVDQGRIFAAVGRYDQAIEVFTRAIEFAPGNAEVFKLRGIAFFSGKTGTKKPSRT
jgi:tetratricopeptide (TPR) repeat protein